MRPRALKIDEFLERQMYEPSNLRHLFHRLNNQLGIILAHAELIEAKSTDERNKSRAAQVVLSVLEAMGTTKEIQRRTSAAPDAADEPEVA